jgi:prepilin-type N-terminal cleavage/methylation domain-containing protein
MKDYYLKQFVKIQESTQVKHIPLSSDYRMRIKGFTLIELLVVVLIIGILAAIALVQYQKAIERSRSAELLLTMRAVWNAQQEYKLINGKDAKDFIELGIDIPGLTYGSYNIPNATLKKPNRFQILISTAYDLIGLPIKGNKCQNGNSFASSNNSCYMLLMLNGVISCVNGTRAPVLSYMSCEAMGFAAE